MFCAPTETLVQGKNDANKMRQAFFLNCFMHLMGLDKGES